MHPPRTGVCFDRTQSHANHLSFEQRSTNNCPFCRQTLLNEKTAMSHHTRLNRGFTLLETLMVISVVLVLISLMLPAVQSARAQARRTACVNNLMQIGIALHNYQTCRNVLPPGCVNVTRSVSQIRSRRTQEVDEAEFGRPREGVKRGSESPVKESLVDLGYRMSWIAQILPQLGKMNVYRQIDFMRPEYSYVTSDQMSDRPERPLTEPPVTAGDMQGVREESRTVKRKDIVLSVLDCPSNGKPAVVAFSDYAGCHASTAVPIDINNDGLLYLNSSESLYEIPDGASNTILVGEKRARRQDSGWMTGNISTLRNTGVSMGTAYASVRTRYYAEEGELSTAENAAGFASFHTGICNFLLADGSIRAISDQISIEVLQNLGSRNDGCLISSFDF